MTTGALVLPETSVGMIEQSTTRSPSIPCTRRRASVTARESEPILHVPDGWKIVAPVSRANSSNASSPWMSAPGRYSSVSSWLQCVGRGKPARELNTFDCAAPVGFRREIVRTHGRRLEGVTALDRYAAARLGSELTHREGAAPTMDGGRLRPGPPIGVPKWNWMSGVADPGRTRVKSPPWLMPTANGPLRVSSHCKPMRALPDSEDRSSLVVIGLATLYIRRTCRWSCRFSPTPGRSCTTSMP